ncbi:flap endonuclease [Candidatus Legionella polyplacis]|uniref:5'-3' exonuclease H3TH domain-containing protein n=1 Tax=Candidatus Legionella polyplacis TaxID=2005262 RepID=A0ABZ2GV51_9GAMM|nr:5'-3' exonuclease H3TH domain-containing protein [Candidatus Legionella polyplacis]ATW01877.1 flap endonuclease [Candidatus Legionella polyplacis]
MKPLILIDGSSYFFRAFHAIPLLKTSTNFPTNAIYGVIKMVNQILKTFSPKKMAIIFDCKEKTFRHKLYPQYKKNRPKTPNKLICQFTPLIKILNAMGINTLFIKGIEADDIIGTIANQYEKNNIPVLISTTDKDMLQLVSKTIFIINTKNNEIIDENKILKKFNIKPNQFIDYLSLIGDKSDNIPGIFRCGPKTAVQWIKTYNTLENIIKNSNSIKGKIGDYLKKSIKYLPIYKKLITIQKNINLSHNIKNFNIKKPNKTLLNQLSKKMEFKINI